MTRLYSSVNRGFVAWGGKEAYESASLSVVIERSRSGSECCSSRVSDASASPKIDHRNEAKFLSNNAC